MPRRTREWVGSTPDTTLPNWVYRRLWQGQWGICGKCGRPLVPGNVQREHLKPVWAGGENRESNIQLWCAVPCSSKKDAEEAPLRAKGDRMLTQHLGLKTKKQLNTRPIPGTKRSGWKHKMDGSWEKR